jgi:hypothetical protein
MAICDKEKPYLRCCDFCSSREISFIEHEFYNGKNDNDGIYNVRFYCVHCRSIFSNEIIFPKHQIKWIDDNFMINLKRSCKPLPRNIKVNTNGISVVL